MSYRAFPHMEAWHNKNRRIRIMVPDKKNDIPDASCIIAGRVCFVWKIVRRQYGKVFWLKNKLDDLIFQPD
mgnify:CR=1 FL=1